MKISPYIIYLEIQPNALLLRQNFDSQKVSVTAGDILHLEDDRDNLPNGNVQGPGEQTWALEVYKGDKQEEQEIEVEDDGVLKLYLDEEEAA
jgi:hypothetical protein